MSAAAPATPPAGVDYPGKTLGIVAIVLAFVFTILGLILGIVAQSQSKAAGYKNTPAKVAIILSIIFIALSIIGLILYFALFAALIASSGGVTTTY